MRGRAPTNKLVTWEERVRWIRFSPNERIARGIVEGDRIREVAGFHAGNLDRPVLSQGASAAWKLRRVGSKLPADTLWRCELR